MTEEEARAMFAEKTHYLYLVALGYVYSVTARPISVRQDWEKGGEFFIDFRIKDGQFEGDVYDLPGILFRTWPEAYEVAIAEAESDLRGTQQRINHLEEERDNLIRGAAAV